MMDLILLAALLAALFACGYAIGILIDDHKRRNER